MTYEGHNPRRLSLPDRSFTRGTSSPRGSILVVFALLLFFFSLSTTLAYPLVHKHNPSTMTVSIPAPTDICVHR